MFFGVGLHFLARKNVSLDKSFAGKEACVERDSLKELLAWQSNPKRKPLLIRGARQVGKTWLMQEFGRRHYAKSLYINFENNPQMTALFRLNFDLERIKLGLELETNQKIDPASTLLIFDEIQAAPEALAALKYFQEQAPELQIVAAGSLLGVALHAQTSFPVGKVDFLDLHPMTFAEFLTALGKEALVQRIEQGDWELLKTFKTTYIEALKTYLIVGGMPEVVQDYVHNLDFNNVRALQKRILLAYEQDFSKHVPAVDVPKLRQLWNSIPSQLAKENRKFIYGAVRKGSRAKEYERSLLWLNDCGLTHQISRVTAPKVPLQAYQCTKAFKLYSLDVGLLGCQANLAPRILLEGDDLFVEFKGALTEQFVLQELCCQPNLTISYWTNDAGSAEIDFLIESDGKIIPVEVKASINLKSKSLQVFREKYNPSIALRISLADFRLENALCDLPLYALAGLKNVLQF